MVRTTFERGRMKKSKELALKRKSSDIILF